MRFLGAPEVAGRCPTSDVSGPLSFCARTSERRHGCVSECALCFQSARAPELPIYACTIFAGGVIGSPFSCLLAPARVCFWRLHAMRGLQRCGVGVMSCALVLPWSLFPAKAWTCKSPSVHVRSALNTGIDWCTTCAHAVEQRTGHTRLRSPSTTE